MIQLGPWAPDLPVVKAPHLRTAKNVLPMVEGYEPFNELTTITGALTARCIGAVSARDTDQAHHLYCGDSTKLYELEGFTWTDRSKIGGYGPAGDSTRWRFATFGDRLIATNGSDAIQYIDMSTAATTFADLPDSPPSAQFITSFGEFVVIGSLSTSGMSIKWSDFGNSEEWTAGTGESDEQEFADGGRITGLAGLDVLYIFQEHSIRRMAYIGGPTIMQIDKLSDGVGCIEPNSLVQWGSLFFFLSEDGFYLFDGQQTMPIGVGSFDRWFLENSSRQYWNRMSSAINPTRKLVCWAYCSASNATGVPDRILFYNWAAKKASYAVIDTEIILGAESLAISIDDLSSTDIDTLTISFDDPFFLGGAGYFAGFNTDHTLGSFAGDALEATMETGSYALAKGRASIEWFRPVTDSSLAKVAGAATLIPESAPTYGASVSQQVSGRCPQRGINGNYVSAKMIIPAAASWTFSTAIDLKAREAGAR
jgi:hypothetical protein